MFFNYVLKSLNGGSLVIALNFTFKNDIFLEYIDFTSNTRTIPCQQKVFNWNEWAKLLSEIINQIIIEGLSEF